MAIRRNAATPAAGPFNVEDEFQFKCSVRKGDVRQNPRGGEILDFKVKISEGLDVAKAKVLSFVRRTLPAAQLISEDLYFKKSKGAPQSQYVILTDENFVSMTKKRWDLIPLRDVTDWATKEQKTVLEGFVFETFMYIHKRPTENIPTGLRRASTAGRIEASARQIREYEERNNVQFGPITRQHIAIHQARQPEGAEFAMPDDNTTRQAQFLDERRQDMARTREEEGDNDRHHKKIKIRFSGGWVDVEVDVTSLRAALGLPSHDIFQEGIFHDYVHNETAGQEDTDDGAIQPTDLSVFQPTLPAANDNDEDQDAEDDELSEHSETSRREDRSRSTTPTPAQSLRSNKTSGNVLDSKKEINDIKKANLEIDLRMKTKDLHMKNIGYIEQLKGEPNYYSKEQALALFPDLGEIINIIYN